MDQFILPETLWKNPFSGRIFNQITEIKRLDRLTYLQSINLSGNPIQKDEQHLVGKSAQEFVINQI